MRGWLVGLAALALIGCATVSGDNAAFTAMTKDKAPFSKTGPEQIVPDSYLDAGTRVRIVGHGGDSVLVQLVDGETGFIPATDVTEAPDDSPVQP